MSQNTSVAIVKLEPVFVGLRCGHRGENFIARRRHWTCAILHEVRANREAPFVFYIRTNVAKTKEPRHSFALNVFIITGCVQAKILVLSANVDRVDVA